MFSKCLIQFSVDGWSCVPSLLFTWGQPLEKTDAGRDWGQEEKEMTEDEMAGWHHRLDGHEFG